MRLNLRTMQTKLAKQLSLTLITALLVGYLLPVQAQNKPSPTLSKPQSQPLPTDYYLAGGDRIRIYIIEAPEYSGEYLIPPDGKLYLPLIGSVSVLGLTQEQAAEAISAKYARYLKR